MAATELIRKTYRPGMTVGQVYARPWGSNAALAEIGNVLELTLEHKENVVKQQDMTRLGGGTHAEVRRVEDVEISMKLADLNIVNLARATLGTVQGVDAGNATDEPDSTDETEHPSASSEAPPMPPPKSPPAES